MCAVLAKGYTFGATEEVTAAKLHSLVDSGSISGIVAADISAGVITDTQMSDVSGAKLTDLDTTPAGAKALPIANGGTASTTAGAARTALGLGTMATQNLGAVNIDGGTIDGITDLPIADGGTGESTAQAAIDALLPAQAGKSGQFLTTDASNASWAAITEEKETIALATQDTTEAAGNLKDATGLSFSVAANKVYAIEGFIVWAVNNTTYGIKLSATGPAAPTFMAGHFITDAANGTPDSSSFNADDVVVTTPTSMFTAGNIAALHCVLSNAGNAGTFQIRFANEDGGGSTTVKAGSFLRYRLLN